MPAFALFRLFDSWKNVFMNPSATLMLYHYMYNSSEYSHHTLCMCTTIGCHLHHSTKTASLKILLPNMFHHVSRDCEDLDRVALGDFLFSRQLLDGLYDLLGVLDSHLHRMAEVLLQHVLSRRLNHHWQTESHIKEAVYDVIIGQTEERLINNLWHWAENYRCWAYWWWWHLHLQ